MALDYAVIVRGNNLGLEGGFIGLANLTLVTGFDGGPLLFDCGHYANRVALQAGLTKHGLKPGDVRAVFLSHLHFDHALNIDLFPTARVYLAQAEYDYAAAPAAGDVFIPWGIRDQLARRELVLLEGERELAAGVRCFPAPGHTPGSMALAPEIAGKGTVVLCGDAIKYAKEVMARKLDYAFAGNGVAAATIDRILAMADRIVPGHFPEMTKRKGHWTWEEPAAFTLLVR